MQTWKDTTSYSQHEKHPKEARTWELRTNNLRLAVTRHIDYPECWVLDCRELGLSKNLLESKEIGAAKREAVEKLSSYVDKLAEELHQLVKLHKL
jgi:hypothetical protein